MIEDVGNRLLREFANCLEQRLGHEQAVEETAPPADAAAQVSEERAYSHTPDAQKATVPPPPPPQAKPIGGFSLFLGVLRDRLKRLFNR
jgi:hypothetical protein